MTASTAEDWVRRFHPAPAAPHRLLCLPHAGGSASYFFPVSRALSPGIEVLAVQYPGRQDRRAEPLIDSIEVLADQVTDAIDGFTDKPLAIFGHSMGATLGFEVARRLEKRGVVPAALFASGRRAPSRHRDEKFHEGSDDELLANVRSLAGTEQALLGDDEIVRMVLPAIRADYRAAETYRYPEGPDLSCPIFAMVGDDDPKATVDEAGSWERHTSGPFELKVFPGGHFYLNEHNAAILDIIAAQLRSPSRI
ncbi:thioesterase II family protein [Amycolatopsis sp. YIM 10]|uniref:thioesterase II family protein n=1 Tax=Amycolatopsis sp. YIM 10 TaxID=2653857 RepID=UPI00129012C2|nr:thioesterase II family protein [Amycolatopsis sp. YIM 10]QFU93199.1 Phenyloxazoline synthase MbtB [Amycolatopsis sp. YIM 10]